MRVACAPAGVALPAGTDIPFTLYSHRQNAATGAVGGTIPGIVEALKLRPSARAWDFLSISLAVIAADESCTRALSADGWTRQIELTVAVIDTMFWSSVADDLQRALSFVTGDIWRLTFIEGGYLPKPPKVVSTRKEDGVCLLSGGMDSLIGAIDLISQGHKPLLVSQVAKGDKFDQQNFAKRVAPSCLHLQVNHNASPPCPSERSQRGRSLVFFGLGVLAATCLQTYGGSAKTDLIVPENGFISLNVPLTPLRIGSLSTRTTHPYYIASLQSLLDKAGLNIRIRNPYQFKTKGEMLAECQDQPLLKSLVSNSTSCGRYARSGFRQCGRCVPCLVRRAAFQRWLRSDLTAGYKFSALGTPDKKHRDFDDVRSVAYAIHSVKQRGLDAWIGGALNSAMLGASPDARGVVERGLEELSEFLISQGVL